MQVRLLLLLLLCDLRRPLASLTESWRFVVTAEAAAASWSHTAVFTVRVAKIGGCELLKMEGTSY